MTKRITLDEALLRWASPVQAQYLREINEGEYSSFRAYADSKGILHQSVTAALRRLQTHAAVQGYSPAHDMTHAVPDPFRMKGVSTYYDKDGKPRGQWVKSALDHEKWRVHVVEAAAAMAEDLPRAEPVAFSKSEDVAPQLCNVYTLTDSHVGMLAWHKEGGADWDLKIAEATLTKCFQALIESAPRAGTCVVAQLGDFLHYDGLMPVTPTAGNVLDSDGRFAKMVEVSVRILRHVVRAALNRHEKVVVLMAEGNHDMAGAVWLRIMMKALYENEPRVEVIDSEKPYYTHRHGAVMLAWHHGHLAKKESLPLSFAAEYPRLWGETTYRYCHTGHQHHIDEKEHPGMLVTQHPTLAARDAYASRHGWSALRQIMSVTYHDRYGQVSRNMVSPEMVE